MNPFVEAVAVVVEAVVVVEVAVAVEEVMAVVVVEEVMAVMVMEVVVTVMEDADTVADTDADIMEEAMEEAGVAGVAGGPLLVGLIAEASPVLIIFSKSLNDHPFSQ
jgi:hypothetical protein